MRVMFLGDIVGRNARDAVQQHVPKLKADYALDAVIVNGENAAHGFGITPQICTDLFNAGVDCITTGNHVWDQREIMSYIVKEPRLLRPLNFPEGTMGRGFYVFETAKAQKILIVNAMARLFMDAMDDPFAAMEKLLAQYRLGQNVNAIFLDFHGEATSEKMAMGHYLDGRVSFVIGTHTHIPSADTQILTGGTGYQTEAGMCGPYDSVIGMEKHIAIHRFTKKTPADRLSPAEGEVTLSGVIFETDDKTGLCIKAEPLRLGGRLKPSLPVFQ